jgi:hypothetical protein
MMKIHQWRGDLGESWIVNLLMLFLVVFSCFSILIPWCPYPLLVLECIGVSKTLPFLDVNSSPPKYVILPSYVEARAQAFVAHVSRVRHLIFYDIVVKTFIDDEVQKWNRLSMCWTRRWTALAWAFVWS